MPTWLPEAQLPVGDVPSSGHFLRTSVDPQATAALDTSVDTPPLASIFSEIAPVCLSMDLFRPPKRVQQRPLTLFDSIPITLSSIYDQPYSVGGPLAPVALAEEPELVAGPPIRSAEAEPVEPSYNQSTPSTRASGLLPTGVGTQENAAKTSASLLVSPTPQRSHQGSANRPCEDDKLTVSVNRKRAHEDTSDEDRSAPVTPAANKRRNLGPPGSTPFANRRTPLSRRIQTKAAPFSARLARREAEKHGRIESTLFRLPDYLRQLEADRRKAERAPSSPSPQLPQTSFDFTMEPTMATTQDSAGESSVPQEPSTPERNTPETPQSGWNLRGLLSSVPRSFSRLLPFGRSSRTSEAQTIELSSERITRTRLVDTESTSSQNELRFRRRLSEGPAQPAKKRARNLSYSLFPAPIDRSLYLGDVPKPPTALPKSCSPDSHRAEQETAQTLKTQEITASDDQTKGREVLPQAVNEEGQKKRKRSPSPDVIPNPAGSSYGLDLDYFCYSSDSEDEAAGTPSKQGEPKKAGGLAETAARSALRSERASSKKVRFDASPEDTPSKLRSRARATDPYRGTHFIGMGNGSASAPTTPTPPARAEQSSQPQPGFIPNTQGTFQLDYDTFPDDSESSGPSTPRSAAAPGTAAREEELRAASQPEGYDTQSSTPRPIPRVPSTPGKVDEQALARVRSQAEKYKPKTPSGLRTTSRYSSPLTAPATSDTVADKQKPKEPSGSAESEKVEKPENFGDDEFARDAEWLYQNCPSGDLSQLKWPARQGYEESLGVSPASMQLLATIWDDSEIEPAYLAFRQSFEEFKKTLA